MSKTAILCFTIVATALSVVSCNTAAKLTSIQLIPSGASLTAVGETVQFKAIGTYEHGSHPVTTSDITSQVTWASSEVAVATISTSGLATAVGTGSTTVTASMGGVLADTTLGVSSQAVSALISISIIPNPQVVTNVGEPTQFIAIGTFTTAPLTQDLTDQVTWQSSDVSVATINSAGLAIGNQLGTTTITALETSNGAVITGTSTLTVTVGGGTVTLPQLSIYEVGAGTGTITSSPVGIDCTPVSAAGCTGNFVLGTVVTLTVTPSAGSTFGGWSSNCTTVTATTCTVTMSNNEPVGAILN